MIYKLLGGGAENALNGTTAVHAIALMKGANLLRVHDVKAAVETVRIFNALQNNDLRHELQHTFNYAFRHLHTQFQRYTRHSAGSLSVIQVLQADEVVGLH